VDLPKSRDAMVRFLALIWLDAAGELIHEIVLAMSHKLKISALSGIHLSTLAEVNSKAAFELKAEVRKPQTSELLEKLFHFLRALG